LFIALVVFRWASGGRLRNPTHHAVAETSFYQALNLPDEHAIAEQLLIFVLFFKGLSSLVEASHFLLSGAVSLDQTTPTSTTSQK